MLVAHENLVIDAKFRGISYEALGLACAQAYIEEERRVTDIMAEMKGEE